MELKATKGEWKTSLSRNESEVYSTIENVSMRVCNIGFGEVSQANAHLIAAAPNGFALGELVMKMCDHHEGLNAEESDILYKAASSFIKKCKGES